MNIDIARDTEDIHVGREVGSDRGGERGRYRDTLYKMLSNYDRCTHSSRDGYILQTTGRTLY